jgi:hypothetical protein
MRICVLILKFLLPQFAAGVMGIPVLHESPPFFACCDSRIDRISVRVNTQLVNYANFWVIDLTKQLNMLILMVSVDDYNYPEIKVI